MFDEKDHAKEEGGMTFAAKFAWVAVAFVFLLMVVPALMMSAAPQASVQGPQKRTYTVPLNCYGSADGTGRSVLVCDYPVAIPPNKR